MKKIIAIASLATLASVAVSAHNGIYVSGNLGANKVGIDSKDQPSKDQTQTETDKADVEGNVAVGYAKGPMRAEISAGQLKTKQGDDADKVTVTPIMVNGYYDFHTNSPVQPFVGVGFGDIRMDKDDLAAKDKAFKEDNFGYQGIVGAKYVVNTHVDVTADYRYLSTAEKKDAKENKQTFHANIAEAGVTYHF